MTPFSPIAVRVPRPRDVSPLAIVAVDRGRPRRAPRPTCIVLHQTGAGLVERAARLGVDPEEFAVGHYAQAEAYPNYLLSSDGDVYALADDDERTAHAKWTPEELRVYRRSAASPLMPEWWRTRWSRRGVWRVYRSPIDLLRASGGTTPNASGIGVEVVHHRPMAAAAYTSLARLVLDRGLHHAIPLGDGRDLPSPFLLGHSDLSPLRRTSRGRPYDPDLVLDWGELQAAIGRESNLTWRTWA